MHRIYRAKLEHRGGGPVVVRITKCIVLRTTTGLPPRCSTGVPRRKMRGGSVVEYERMSYGATHDDERD